MDAKKYSVLALNISSAFHKTFFNASAHTYATGSQAADVFALEMGAVPLSEQENILAHLTNDIRQHNYHTSCGEVALPSWFRMLSHYGHAIVHGATALTEDWDGPLPTRGQQLSSQNHFMFGAVDEWLTRSLAGIQQTADSVDYRILFIKPTIVGNITFVKANLILNIEIPAGSVAYVHVPGWNVTPNYGTLVQQSATTNTTIFRIKSGNYGFQSTTFLNTR
ncbi:unnamed protein product [Adineta ricciae]|uniref:alpha-L-rhamnosidase n=1 Tax=Adineta ricciae TaxID=249248 RepID=A0A814VAS1_ADIRI|nr:unnamed protein product [Adineta ricciae]